MQVAEIELKKEPFGEHSVEWFIEDFAQTSGDAQAALQDMGINRDFVGEMPELFRNLCRAWRINPLAVYDVAGVFFWRTAKEYASWYYDKRNKG